MEDPVHQTNQQNLFQGDKDDTHIVFIVDKGFSPLIKALQVFKEHQVDFDHIESRHPSNGSSSLEYLISGNSTLENNQNLVQDLQKVASDVKVLPRNNLSDRQRDEVPWFPTKISDLDRFANKVMSYGKELDADHPGFKDDTYRAKRNKYADLAINYRHGQPIPNVEYSDSEIGTWGTVFRELVKLYPTHACQEFNHAFSQLVETCGYRDDNIPQLGDVSNFLKERTGFSIRPVAGLLEPRDFLAGLAFRVFHATQYVRHESKPMYTPEPDVCHELLGHVPMFADPSFAEFSHEIGLASLGASDEDIKKLSTLYWFSVEFGLCQQEGKQKVYGAALLSSFGELEYCLTGKSEIRPFIPEQVCDQEYPISTFQPVYFIAESFETAKKQLKNYAAKINRPISVRYNPYTQSIDVIKN